MKFAPILSLLCLLGLGPAWARAQGAPRSFSLGAATLTPGGFLDLTGVYRSTAVGSGIGTSFGSIPFAATVAGELSEFRFSAQNSRLSLRVDARPGREQLTAYVEVDFLGNAPSNLVVTSNSDTLRLRLYWVELRRGGWEVLAGQSWSLLTPNRKGLSPLPADVFYTLAMDTNYQVGLTWARDPQVRLVRHWGERWALGVALENPEQYIGGGVALPSSFYAGQFGTGASSATPNPRPDVVAKLAFDSGGRRRWHAEVAGLLRGFRDVDASGVRHRATGGGMAVDGNVALTDHVRLVASSFWSDGGGRYIFGLGPDLVVRPDGTISPVHAASGVGGFEWQTAPGWTLFGYYGGAYFARNFSLAPASPAGFVGFGFPGAASGVNRAIQEATAGTIRTFWRRADYGALALITQYSYLTRAPWSGNPGGPAQAHSNMFWADLRYTLP